MLLAALDCMVAWRYGHSGLYSELYSHFGSLPMTERNMLGADGRLSLRTGMTFHGMCHWEQSAQANNLHAFENLKYLCRGYAEDKVSFPVRPYLISKKQHKAVEVVG